MIELHHVNELDRFSLADACRLSSAGSSVRVWFTDPPYYDAVPYSDLSDFFFVWLKRALPGHPLLRDPFDPTNLLSPKLQEAVQDETKQVDGQPKDRAFFEATMARLSPRAGGCLREDGVGSVVFAHKTTEGWEALLSGMIRGGWTITGSWPIATEMATRLRARDPPPSPRASTSSAARAPTMRRSATGPRFSASCPTRVADWMERLQGEGVRGADLVFACIGPALEDLQPLHEGRDAEGREIPLGGNPEAREAHQRGYLAKVWEVVGRSALAQVLGTAEAKARNGAAGAVEEDARLTALFLWTLQATTQDAEPDATTDDEDEDAERTMTTRTKHRPARRRTRA